jgi:1,6-anhydro-N-acetylmuramate kinase
MLKKKYQYAELLDVKRSELGISDEDFMATLVEVTAQSIARSYSTYDVSEVLVSGGGGRNTFLLERLAQALTKIFPNRKVSVSTHESIGIDRYGIHRRCQPYIKYSLDCFSM